MNRIYPFPLLLTALISLLIAPMLSSCSDDDTPNIDTTKQLIVGTWKTQSGSWLDYSLDWTKTYEEFRENGRYHKVEIIHHWFGDNAIFIYDGEWSIVNGCIHITYPIELADTGGILLYELNFYYAIAQINNDVFKFTYGDEPLAPNKDHLGTRYRSSTSEMEADIEKYATYM